MERVEGAECVVNRSGQRSPTLSRKLNQYEHVAHPPALSIFGGSVSLFTENIACPADTLGKLNLKLRLSDNRQPRKRAFSKKDVHPVYFVVVTPQLEIRDGEFRHEAVDL